MRRFVERVRMHAAMALVVRSNRLVHPLVRVGAPPRRPLAHVARAVAKLRDEMRRRAVGSHGVVPRGSREAAGGHPDGRRHGLPCRLGNDRHRRDHLAVRAHLARCHLDARHAAREARDVVQAIVQALSHPAQREDPDWHDGEHDKDGVHHARGVGVKHAADAA
eukprot:5172932-Pleurochrysis_carterae.AAC.1